MSQESVDLGTVYKGSKSGRIVKAEGGKRVVGDDDVVIDILISGMCGTDLHYTEKADMVLGHEGMGKITKMGKNVKGFKIGDRAGWGYVHNACLQASCPGCAAGFDTRCVSKTEKIVYAEGDLDQGSFGDRAVINYRFAHKIPDDMEDATAAVAQCGGATVFGAMREAGVTPFSRVGIVGIGGLGHLALQFANRMGADVVAFSGSDSKKDEALKLGAHEFVAAKTNPKFEGVAPLDFLVVSTSAQPDWSAYVPILAPGAKILPLSVSNDDFQFPYMAMIGKVLTIKGTFVATRAVHAEMLKFAARHKIAPVTEELPMDEENLNKAAERLKKGDVRYRFVLRNTNNKP